jgi:hypothetical protein
MERAVAEARRLEQTEAVEVLAEPEHEPGPVTPRRRKKHRHHEEGEVAVEIQAEPEVREEPEVVQEEGTPRRRKHRKSGQEV